MNVAFQICMPVPRAVPRRRRACCARPCVRASIGEEIESALRTQFAENDIKRVLESFSAVREGRYLERGRDTPRHQRAHSFVKGLTAEPFHDLEQHPWVLRLQDHWKEMADELAGVISKPELLEKGTNVWAKPVVDAANAYGPEWRTLVLQDREWDPVNTSIFPVTSAILQDKEIDAPSVEAFFARQAPSSGIKIHTDDCNFILTMHLALDAPPNQSWIEVGGERRYWENGQGLVFDTSFYHRTMNESDDKNRTVLLVRFWHPELTLTERSALLFLFKAIEDPSSVAAVLMARNARREARRKAAATADPLAEAEPEPRTERRRRQRTREKKSNTSSSSGGRGFGGS